MVRGAQASAAAVLAVMLLGACSSGRVPEPGTSSGQRPEARGPTRSRQPASAPVPSRSVWCRSGEALGRLASRPPSDKTDVVVGPLRWSGLKSWQDGRRTDFGGRTGGGWHYKIGAEIERGSVVTVSVAPEARHRAGLGYGQKEGFTPAAEVTFSACTDSDTVYVGGFFVAGDGRFCLPLDVRVGKAAPRRIVIPVFSGGCPT
ncbi:hypothetical protein SAMN02787118_1343 [Streptomyces mirabilis]|uniref:Lipoprotein n=1 Tax=Streptomyces mirabilis TaxID=68239 RepID=A0A1I2W2G9_9ACTN|nr:hypothetical protein SAMN02787118_1343 [Streptomyces mirabilis]